MQLFEICSYLCGRVAQRNIDVLSAEKEVDGRLDDLQTNGLDGLRATIKKQKNKNKIETVKSKEFGSQSV